MTHAASRPTVVYVALLLATVAALLLASSMARELLTARGAAAGAALVAFVKARFIVSDFMELRGTWLQWVFDVWMTVGAAGSAVLILR